MEYNIYDLMDEFADEDIELSPYNAADLRRIEELTMKKIEEQQGRRPAAKKAGRIARALLVAAVVTALCTATVVAAMGGNIIVKVKEARVAISEEMARKIMV